MPRSPWWLLLAAVLCAPACAHRAAVPPPAAAPAASVAAPAGEEAGPGPDEEGDAGEVADPAEEPDEFGEAAPAGPGDVADPLAPWNRAMFTFNDRFYFWVLKPVARTYGAVVPRPVRTGVVNLFHNLGTPGRFVSDLLQLKGREAAVEAGAFIINSTWGVLGLVNWLEANPEAKVPAEDLGQVLGRYGVGQGFYVVWPLLGPSTLRDSVTYVGDLVLDPASHLGSYPASLGAHSCRVVNATSFQIGDYESLKDAAIDPYLAVRDAYIQHRAKETKE